MEMLKVPGVRVGVGGWGLGRIETLLCAAVATASDHHGLDAWTVYDIFYSILKSNKPTEHGCTEVTQKIWRILT